MTSVGGAIRTVLVAASLTDVRVYRYGQVPEGAELPYLVFDDTIANIPQLIGDAATMARRRLAQIDLWQADTLGAGADATLADQVADAVDGAPLSIDPGKAFRLRVEDAQRIEEPTNGLMHTAFTVGVTVLR